mmetsp:Transcript_23363/g.54266  ORF Transcript_23363/g.54266 Transcript_23363/m.54266 type:complete len:424 (-) Transcript_23363:84-1355(-)
MKSGFPYFLLCLLALGSNVALGQIRILETESDECPLGEMLSSMNIEVEIMLSVSGYEDCVDTNLDTDDLMRQVSEGSLSTDSIGSDLGVSGFDRTCNADHELDNRKVGDRHKKGNGPKTSRRRLGSSSSHNRRLSGGTSRGRRLENNNVFDLSLVLYYLDYGVCTFCSDDDLDQRRDLKLAVDIPDFESPKSCGVCSTVDFASGSEAPVRDLWHDEYGFVVTAESRDGFPDGQATLLKTGHDEFGDVLAVGPETSTRGGTLSFAFDDGIRFNSIDIMSSNKGDIVEIWTTDATYQYKVDSSKLGEMQTIEISRDDVIQVDVVFESTGMVGQIHFCQPKCPPDAREEKAAKEFDKRIPYIELDLSNNIMQKIVAAQALYPDTCFSKYTIFPSVTLRTSTAEASQECIDHRASEGDSPLAAGTRE